MAGSQLNQNLFTFGNLLTQNSIISSKSERAYAQLLWYAVGIGDKRDVRQLEWEP